jgi:molybdopterin/thiamine biosynthesis adenylyltransferase
MKKNVIIVGAGALGSHLALFLRNEAVLKVIDFDRVERKNVLAQFHGAPGVGKNKAHSLQQTMQFLFGIQVAAVPHKLAWENAEVLLNQTRVDLIIDCLDNGASREIVQGVACREQIPCLHGALAADGTFGRVVWDENFVIDSEAVQGQATCEGGEHLPFIGIASALLARAAQEFLTNGKKIGFELHPGGVTRT